MTTNAQAALQAAATVHSGSRQYGNGQTVTNLAFQFKNWLDSHDRRDVEKAAEERDSIVERTYGLSRGGVNPEPPKPGPFPPRRLDGTYDGSPGPQVPPYLPPDGTVPGR